MRIRVGSIPSILFFSLTTVLLLSFGLADDAFAAAFSPIQPNAYVSYDNSTNQVQIEWDFTTGGNDAPETCLLKGDFWFFTDLNNAYNTDQSQSDNPSHPYFDHVTKIKGFIPIHYSVVSSNPTIVGPGQTTEVIPCEGSARINLDTVMSHESNVFQDGVTPRQDLQIFLSFYALAPNTSVTLENFDFQSPTYMEQIFVAYTPDVTWNTGFKNYACAGEPGNVLYIDKSASDGSLIAHGNNGDNCDKYLYIENNQYVDIGGANNDASLTNGETFYGDHDAESYSLLTFVVSYTSTSDSGGCNDCIDPTFYYSQNRIIVKDGFRYNGFSTDLNATHTDMPELITNTTRTNFITLKVFDNSGTDGIEWIEVAFGSPGENISFDQSEVRIETQFSDNSIVESFVYPKDQTLISFGNVTASVVSCGYESDKCLQMTIPHTFNDELVYKAIMIRAIDESRNDKYHYLNEGIKILGEPLYEPPTDKIFIQKYLGSPSSEWVDIVRIDRVNDIWSSEDGMEFKGTDGGGFQRITPLGFDDTLID